MAENKSDFYDLRTRIFSGLLFGLLSFISLFHGGIFASLFLAVCLSVLSWEVFNIFASGRIGSNPLMYLILAILFFVPIFNYYNFYALPMLSCCAIASFVVLERNFLKMICILYIGVSILIFQEILIIDDTMSNLKHLLFVVAIVIASDVGGYFFGRSFGGPKIYRSISPNKTWTGSVGGVVLAIIVSIIVVPFLNYSLIIIITLAFILAISAQAGDFFQSWLKRKYKVKDSGFLLPGHGGFFDRLDGILAAIPVYYGLLYLF